MQCSYLLLKYDSLDFFLPYAEQVLSNERKQVDDYEKIYIKGGYQNLRLG